MHLDGNTLSVVPDRDGVLLTVNLHLDRVHGGVIDLVIRSVDENLVKDLEKTGHVADLADEDVSTRGNDNVLDYSPVFHALGLVVEDPHVGVHMLDGTNIGIGTLENVLQLRELRCRGIS